MHGTFKYGPGWNPVLESISGIRDTAVMKTKIILAVVFLGGLILVLVWMQGGFHSKVPAGRSLASAAKAAPLKTIKIKTTRSKGEVTVSGTVASRETAEIAARAQGYVIEIKADAGDKVKKGDLLLRIDNKEMAERKAQAEAALESAKADLTQTKGDFERFKILYEKQSVAKKELDDATARYGVAKAAERRARAALEEATTLLSHGEVTAPFDGVVADRFVNLGDLVTPGRSLFSLFMPQTAELVVPVGEQYAAFLKEGTPVVIRISSINLTQQSTIREIVPLRDEKTRTITVKVPISKAPGLAPGLYGTLSFETTTSEVIMIPRSAVKTVGQLETVRVVEDGTVKIRHVKTGRSQDDQVEILSGLNPGEELVVQ